MEYQHLQNQLHYFNWSNSLSYHRLINTFKVLYQVSAFEIINRQSQSTCISFDQITAPVYIKTS
ncbi:unnamed protein product [Paramecium sonneborni]|uniref:Uncharacterized protein n=1 Tax=Paramecium sonneborni TaxID=65129 RepID=A0A8S1RPJ2_9CILI|nr:unnamed protein product [Paramecium sonneborni]